ncbi:hypothetical protein L0F63_005633 [Massospora cicadina]|nr:hypothetical protein L0F63_005633 [Massospora cicadina]
MLRILSKERLSVDRGLMAAMGAYDIVLSLTVVLSIVMRWRGHLIRQSSNMCLVTSVVFNSATVLTPVLVAQLSLVRYLAIIEDRMFGLAIIVLVLPSLIVIPICYYKVMAHYKLITLDTVDASLAKRHLKRTTFRITLVMVAYILAFIPEMIHVALSIAFMLKRTALSDAIVMALIFSITIINALFTLLLHEETHRVFKTAIQNSFGNLRFSKIPA